MATTQTLTKTRWEKYSLPEQLIAESLAESAQRTLGKAADYAYGEMKPDGHWYLEVRSSISFTVQWISLRQVLGPRITTTEAIKFRQWLRSQQDQSDGSWGLAPTSVHDWPGDVSTTVEAYFGLKMLGEPVNSKAMTKARNFVRKNGGVAQVNVLTQLVLAMFGIVPWENMAQVPAELMALPSGFTPLNIFSFSYWSRVSAVPVMLLKHYAPVWPIYPIGVDPDDDYIWGPGFLDELWLDPSDRSLNSIPGASALWKEGKLGQVCCTWVDKAASIVEPALKRSSLRSYCLDQCVQYIVNHLDSGGYGSLTISNFLGAMGLHATGKFCVSHPVLKHLTRAMADSLWEDSDGLRMQVTIGPVWDTALMALGLLEAGQADDRIELSIQWFKDHQILETHGDYAVTNPKAVQPGGWSFQYCVSHFLQHAYVSLHRVHQVLMI